MTADVAERAKSSRFVPDDKQRLAGELGGEKSLRVGDGFLYGLPISRGNLSARMVKRANQLPSAAKNLFLFNFGYGGIGVKARSEGVRAFDLFVDVEVERLGG